MTFANTNLYGLPRAWELTSNSFLFSLQKAAIKNVLEKKLLASYNREHFSLANQTAMVSSVLGPKKSLLSWECHMLSPAVWLGWLPTVCFCPGSEAASSYSHYLFFWGSLQHFFPQTKDLKVVSHIAREVMETLADEALLVNGKI